MYFVKIKLYNQKDLISLKLELKCIKEFALNE